MCDCTTTKYKTILNPDFNAYPGDGEDFQGRPEYIEDWVTEDAETIDLDIHRYQCVVCKEIGYYSGAAKDWYEKGITSKGIKGLE